MSYNIAAIGLTLVVGLCCAAGEPLLVSQDGSGQFNGNDHQPIQAAIDRAMKQGGGEVVIARGDYLIGASLKMFAATNLTIRGHPGTVLRLPPLPYAHSLEAASVGATSLRVDRIAGFQPGMRLHFVAPGKVSTFTGKPEPYFRATLAGVEKDRLEFKEPLEFTAPAGTLLYREGAPNVFAIRGATENVVIEHLTMDGGRRPGAPDISGHVIGCGVLAEGPYSYERGATGTPVRRLVVRDCVIRHCFGRGVAMYSVVEGFVERCVIEDTVDEAIDFDHFTIGCRAIGNTVVGCTEGMELNDANDSFVKSNRFDACGCGINLWRWCHQPDLNVHNQILSNQFFNTRGSALLIQAKTASNIVFGNIIQGSGSAGVVLNGSYQTLEGNTVTGSAKEGILVSGSDNEVRGNHCRGNSTAKPGRNEDIRVTGERNRVTDNVVGSQPSRH